MNRVPDRERTKHLPKKRILPFFIPMAGCRKQCVYCDQRQISGEQQAPTPQAVAESLARYQGPPVELAYYGGSFTALPMATMAAYLQAAAPALAQGKVSRIRLSTRPDAVSPSLLAWLVQAGVGVVELGVQSFCDGVLQASGRDYTAAQARLACAQVRAAGMELGIQLMTGLPEDDAQGAWQSALAAAACKPQMLRLYPTLVLADTPLAVRYQSGCYQAQSLTQAVDLAARIYALMLVRQITVIRMGLQPTPSLAKAWIAGPYHPAFGYLVQSRLTLWQLQSLLAASEGQPGPWHLYYASGQLPLVQGERRQNLQYLQQRRPGIVLSASSLPKGSLVLANAWQEYRCDLLSFITERLNIC